MIIVSLAEWANYYSRNRYWKIPEKIKPSHKIKFIAILCDLVRRNCKAMYTKKLTEKAMTEKRAQKFGISKFL